MRILLGQVPADRRRRRAGRQRRHVRRAHRRGARGARRGHPHGLPATRVVRRRADRPRLHRGVVGARRQHASSRPDVLRRLLDRARLPRRRPHRRRCCEARGPAQDHGRDRADHRRRGGASSACRMPMAMPRGRADRRTSRSRCGSTEVPDANLRGAMLEITSGAAPGRNVLDRRRRRTTSSSTGVGEAHFEALARHRRRRRGADRQLGVPRLPDLPPPPGAPRLPGVGPVPRRRASRSTRSGRTDRARVRLPGRRARSRAGASPGR